MAGSPGVGGVNEGPGHVPIQWGEESSEQAAKFEAQALPEARFSDPENTSVVSVGAADPGSEPTAEGAGGGAIETSAGSTTWTRRLSPSHRRAVRTFFNSSGTSSESKK